MLEQLIGSIYNTNSQLPLQYGNLFSSAYQPFFNYYGNQANNMAGMGNQYIGNMASMGSGAMGLYGNLANTQAGMYQAELPFQMEQQKFNALSPVLSGLLGQFGGGFSSLPKIGSVGMQYNRPDVMGGYQGAVDRAYGGVENAYGKAVDNAKSYDSAVGGGFADMMDKLPNAPYQRPSSPGKDGGFGPDLRRFSPGRQAPANGPSAVRY